MHLLYRSGRIGCPDWAERSGGSGDLRVPRSTVKAWYPRCKALPVHPPLDFISTLLMLCPKDSWWLQLPFVSCMRRVQYIMGHWNDTPG